MTDSLTNGLLRRFKPYPAYRPSAVEWLGEIPAHWEVRRLKSFATVQLSNVDKKSTEGQAGVRLCNYTDVYHNEHIGPDVEFMPATATEEQVRRFSLRAGDVLATKDSEDWTDIAVPAVVTQDLPGVLCGYHLAHIRPENSCDGDFLSRAISGIGPRDQYEFSANGITRYGLTGDSIRASLLALPPLAEQRAIAAFVDREAAMIDALVAKKERLIKLLQEKRTALISRAATKGLDPNVPMKDSGVEWLGEIPAHWEVKRIKHISLVRRGASPRPIVDPAYFDADGEYGWVRIADVTASNHYLERTSEDVSELGRSLSVALEPGELIVSIAGSVGKPIITNMKCCIHDGFVHFPGIPEYVEFLYYVLLSNQPYGGLGKLGTQLNLNTDTIGSIQIPSPPLPEQKSISKHLDSVTAKLDVLMATVREAIARLTELRAALISSAVTGRIDVREAMG